MSLTDKALELLQEREYDKLEKELNRISNTFRLCNKIRETAEISAQELLEEKETLKNVVASLRQDKESLMQSNTNINQVVFAQITAANQEAQQRMQEIVELREENKGLRKEIDTLKEKLATLLPAD